jgi:excisionase family DNA binding protein
MEHRIENRVLRAQDVAVMLGLSRKHIYRMATERKLPSVKFEGSLRFPLQDLLEYVERHRRSLHRAHGPDLDVG